MSIKSEIYDAVASSLEGCCDGPRVYIGEDVPVKKFYNACKAYAEYVGFENCVGMTDETIIGNGKKGFLFTYDGFYHYGDPHVLQLYSKGYSFTRLPGYYDIQSVNQLLKKLHGIVAAMPDTVKLINLLADYSDKVVRTSAGSWKHMQKLLKDKSNWDHELINGLYAIMDFFNTVANSAIGRLEMVDFPDPDSASASQLTASYFMFFVCMGALLSRDRELYKGLKLNALTPEQEQTVFANMEKALEIITPFMTWTEDDPDMEPIDLNGHIDEFHKEVVRIDGLLENRDELDLDDLRRLFDESKQAMRRLLDGVQDGSIRVSSFIEVGADPDMLW